MSVNGLRNKAAYYYAFYFSSFPFMWILNINIRCGQQYHDPSTMETCKEQQHHKTDGIVTCNFHILSGVVFKLVLRPKILQLFSEIRSCTFWTILYMRGSLFILRIDNFVYLSLTVWNKYGYSVYVQYDIVSMGCMDVLSLLKWYKKKSKPCHCCMSTSISIKTYCSWWIFTSITLILTSILLLCFTFT